MPDEIRLINESDIRTKFYVRIKEPTPECFDNFKIGRFGVQLLEDKVKPLLDTLSMVYICGPQKMYKEMSTDLQSLGVDKHKIFYV